ncbi:MAG: hypothetical protein ACOC1F_04210 [Myxococcota bacterium]
MWCVGGGTGGTGGTGGAGSGICNGTPASCQDLDADQSAQY